MTDWRDTLKGDPMPWLLERDAAQPAVRYFILRDLLERDESDEELREARADIMSSGPVPSILAAQEPEGYWVKPGSGYAPKYTGTAWQLTFLAHLGADGSDPRLKAACGYVLTHSIASHGGFTLNGTPSSFVHCLAGNLGFALIDLGVSDDERLQHALDFQARMVTGEGIAPIDASKEACRFYRSSTSGPGFACAYNNGLPCAWGAVKAVLAFGKVPLPQRTPLIDSAIEKGLEFLLSRDPAVADYPTGYAGKPSSSWFKFGYPLGYVTDVLQNLEALVLAGRAQDPKLRRALELLLGKQDSRGRWNMEYSYNGKMWADIERKGAPSKWVTLRALRVLKAAYPG